VPRDDARDDADAELAPPPLLAPDGDDVSGLRLAGDDDGSLRRGSWRAFGDGDGPWSLLVSFYVRRSRRFAWSSFFSQDASATFGM